MFEVVAYIRTIFVRFYKRVYHPFLLNFLISINILVIVFYFYLSKLTPTIGERMTVWFNLPVAVQIFAGFAQYSFIATLMVFAFFLPGLSFSYLVMQARLLILSSGENKRMLGLNTFISTLAYIIVLYCALYYSEAWRQNGGIFIAIWAVPLTIITNSIASYYFIRKYFSDSEYSIINFTFYHLFFLVINLLSLPFHIKFGLSYP